MDRLRQDKGLELSDTAPILGGEGAKWIIGDVVNPAI